jgi:hypothetical protein
MLFFCALDAHNEGKKSLGFSALKEILRHYDTMSEDAQQEIRLPILFRYLPSSPLYVNRRCVIRFTYAETDQGKTSDSTIITTLCGHFETGTSFEGK